MMKLFSGVSALVIASVTGLAAAQAETRTITFLLRMTTRVTCSAWPNSARSSKRPIRA